MLADVLAVDVLHDQVRAAVFQRAGRAERDECRMAQSRKQAPLAAEPRGGAPARACQVHELHCHQLAGLDLAAEVDDADAAAPEFANRFVARRKLQRRSHRDNIDAGTVPRGDGLLVGADQRHHQFEQRSIAAAGILDKDGTLFRRHVACAREDGAGTAQAVSPRRIADSNRAKL